MTNPYRGRPDHSFWRQGVAARAAEGVDPVTAMPFTIAPTDAVATAGSCFAQHLSRSLVAQGFRYLVTEEFAATPGTVDEGYGVFPARFGNLYTARQLRQLIDRAYGMFRPQARAWALPGGGVADPFRPRIQAGGFPDLDALEADRGRHLAAVRRMFEACDVFIFTLGLTEGWVAAADGAAVPLHPGVLGVATEPGEWRFENAGFAETLAQMEAFLAPCAASIRGCASCSPSPRCRWWRPTRTATCWSPPWRARRSCARWRMSWCGAIRRSAISPPSRSSPGRRPARASTPTTCAR